MIPDFSYGRAGHLNAKRINRRVERRMRAIFGSWLDKQHAGLLTENKLLLQARGLHAEKLIHRHAEESRLLACVTCSDAAAEAMGARAFLGAKACHMAELEQLKQALLLRQRTKRIQ